MEIKEIFEHAFTGVENSLKDFCEDIVAPLVEMIIICFIYITIPIWFIPYWFIKRGKNNDN